MQQQLRFLTSTGGFFRCPGGFLDTNAFAQGQVTLQERGKVNGAKLKPINSVIEQEVLPLDAGANKQAAARNLG